VLAPARALADQRDLVLALADEHPLDEGGERENVTCADLAERRALIAEDAGVAVLFGADRSAHSHVLEHALQDPHRMLFTRILGVRLDTVELRLREHALDLELRDEHGRLAREVDGERNGPLRREEREAPEIADVGLVEEHEAVEPIRATVFKEALSALAVLGRRDPHAQTRSPLPRRRGAPYSQSASGTATVPASS